MKRRIYDEEMGLRKASASCGQDEQAAEDGREVPASCGQDTQAVEDVREAPAGHGQDKQAVEDVREAPAGHGQDKQAAEDVREAPAGHGQDKQGVEDVREVQGGSGEDKQDPRGTRQTPAGCRQSRLGPQPPPGFPRQVGARHNQPIVPLWQWNRTYPGDPFRPGNVKFTGEERILVPLPRNPTEQDFFKLYIIDQIIDHIVVETNPICTAIYRTAPK